MTPVILGLLALLLAGPVPVLLARAQWPHRVPRAAIVLWQALALAAVRQRPALALGAGRDHHDPRLPPRPRVQGEPVLKLADLREQRHRAGHHALGVDPRPQPDQPDDGGHVVAALWEGASRRLARVRGRERLRPFDTARLVPVAYGVFLLMGGMGLVVLYADVVNPVRLG